MNNYLRLRKFTALFIIALLILGLALTGCDSPYDTNNEFESIPAGPSIYVAESFWEDAREFYGEVLSWQPPEGDNPGLVIAIFLTSGGERMEPFTTAMFYVPKELWKNVNIGVRGQSAIGSGDAVRILNHHNNREGGFFRLPALAVEIERIEHKDVPGWGA